MEKLPESPFEILSVLVFTLAGLVMLLRQIQKNKSEESEKKTRTITQGDRLEVRVKDLEKWRMEIDTWKAVLIDREKREKD